MASPLKFTQQAITRLMHLKNVHGPCKHLVVTVSGGGCSGFQYSFTLSEKLPIQPVQLLARDNCTHVYTDKHSFEIIKGSTLHYSTSLVASKFTLQDIQNTIRSCSCGNSFDLND